MKHRLSRHGDEPYGLWERLGVSYRLTMRPPRPPLDWALTMTVRERPADCPWLEPGDTLTLSGRGADCRFNLSKRSPVSGHQIASAPLAVGRVLRWIELGALSEPVRS